MGSQMQKADHTTMFETWVRQHGGLMRRVARAYTATAEDREDLAQEILLQLWCSLSRFEGRAKASAWTYRVALSTALAWRRADSRQRRRRQSAVALEEIPVENPRHAWRLNHEEALTRLYAAMRALPKLDTALVMLHLDGLSYRACAEELIVSEGHGGVKSTGARKALAELMRASSSADPSAPQSRRAA